MESRLKIFFLAFASLIVYEALCIGFGYVFSEPLYVQFVAYLVIIIVGGLYIRTVLCDTKKYENVSKFFASIATLVIIMFAITSTITVTWLLSFMQDEAFLVAEKAKDTYSSSLKVLTVAMNLIIAPIAEEIIFRSFMYGQLAKVNKLLALIMSSIMFALYHGTIVHLYTGLIGGLILGCIYEKTHRVCYSVAVHSLFNIVTMAVSIITIPEQFFSTIIVMILNVILGAIICLLFKTDGVNKIKQ